MASLINRIFIYPIWEFMIVLFIVTALVTAFMSYLSWPAFKKELEEEKKDKEQMINEGDISEKLSTLSRVIVAIRMCIISPYLETLIFQHAIFRLLGKIYKGASGLFTIYIIISTFVFAWAHGLVNKDWKSTIMHLPLSLALSLIYIFSIINDLSPIHYVFIFHAVWNFIAGVLIPVGVKLSEVFQKRCINVK